MPELPDSIRKRYKEQLQLSPYDIEQLIQSNACSYFETAAHNRNPKKAAAWLVKVYNNKSITDFFRILNDLFGLLNESNRTILQSPVEASQLGAMIDLIESNYISGAIAKEVLEIMFKGDKRDPKQIVDEKGWSQTSDTALIEQLCKKVVAENPKEVAKWKQGNQVSY
jgi:aspartyl-tRNA(Asn)/glutamyl-tRNA(Gln) amidotransferase subunit B